MNARLRRGLKLLCKLAWPLHVANMTRTLLFKMELVLMAGLARDTFCGFVLMGWRFEYLLDSSLDVFWTRLVHVGLPIFCCVAVFLGDD